MFKKSWALPFFFLSLAACSTAQPRVIQASSGSPNVTLTVGMATQIEMPEDARVTSVVVGNSSLVTAEEAGDVVNLSANSGEGETNLIIRARDGGGKTRIYQYRVTVQGR